MNRGRLLAAMYAAATVMLYLYVYPVAPSRMLNLAIAASLAGMAGYAAYAIPVFASLAIFFSEMLAVMNIIAASEPGRRGLYSLILSNMPLLGYILILALALLAAALSARRIRGVVALATGMLAAAALPAPYGHLAALALLSLYAVIAASASRTAMGIVAFEFTRAPVYIASAFVEGRTIGFRHVMLKFTPVQPLVTALFSPVGRPPAVAVRLVYPQLLYLAATFASYLAIYTLVARASAQFKRRVSGLAPEARAVTGALLVYSTLASPFAYLVGTIASIAISLQLKCTPEAPPPVTLGMAGAVAVTGLLIELLSALAHLRSLEEEKEALLESINALVTEIDRVSREALEARLNEEPLKPLKALKGRLLELRSKTERAGLLELPGLERLLADLEAMVHQELNQFYNMIVETITRIRRGCEALAEWASGHMLTEDCTDAIREPASRDIHAALTTLRSDIAKLIEYIETLIEDVTDEAESAGIDASPLNKLRAILHDFRISKPDDVDTLVEEALRTLGSVMGAVKARREV